MLFSPHPAVKLWATNQEHSVTALEAKANVCCVKFNPSKMYSLAFGSAGNIAMVKLCIILSLIVMQSKGIMQLEVEHVTFAVFYLIEVLIRRGTFWWKPHLQRISGSIVTALKDSQNNRKQKRNAFLFLVVSHNQCFRLLTDSARSQHKLDVGQKRGFICFCVSVFVFKQIFRD